MPASSTKDGFEKLIHEKARTPLQVKCKMEDIKNWYLESVLDLEIEARPSGKVMLPPQRVDNLGVPITSIYEHNVSSCVVCGKEGVISSCMQILSGNPFTRSDAILVCRSCTSS